MKREVSDLRGGTPKPSVTMVVLVCGAALTVGGIALSRRSITGSYDSPCGSILAANTVWATESSCGIAHIGTLAIVIALTATGSGLISAALLSSRRHTSLRVAGLLTAAVAVLGVVATVFLALRVATYHEPVLRRGWTAVRDVSAVATIGLCLVAGLLALAIAHPPPSNATR